MNAGAKHDGPLVSVLMCTYNRPRFLPEALASVFAQTYTNFELVLTRDGGCPVREAIEPFLPDQRLIFVDRDENRGKAYSLNRAMERAGGKYVCYLDDDDAWYPNHIAALVEALEADPRFGLAYSDLYKAHCRVLPDGRRVILSKNVEISRDFDRMVMLQFNHALHVSVMHRRELLEKAGGYNEHLKVLIDWDLTRRLCFYTDFLHLPIVTGQYYAPVGECDRISVQQRKNVNDYLRNLLTIRNTRPPKPWPCMPDLAVVVLADRCDASLEQTLQMLWSQSFYPRVHYVPLPPEQLASFQTGIPDAIPVAVAQGATMGEKLDAVLDRCEAELIAIVPVGLRVEKDEIAFLERSLNPLLNGVGEGTAYELVEATEEHWGAVIARNQLLRARAALPSADVRQSLAAAAIAVPKPEFTQYPFQFDNFLTAAAQVEQSGDWRKAAKIYDFIASQHGNTLWMRTLQANACYHAGDWQQAAELLQPINQAHPTVSRLLIEARCLQKMGAIEQAVDRYRQAEAICEGREFRRGQSRPKRTAAQTAAPTKEINTQETLHGYLEPDPAAGSRLGTAF